MKAAFKLPSSDMESIESLVKLYSGPEDHYSHRIRFTLKIKDVKFKQENISSEIDIPEELKMVNPLYKEKPVPTLIDRELVLYEPNIIMHYINERFPSPPLSPALAKDKAESLMLLWRIETTIIDKAQKIINEKNNFKAIEMSNELRNILVHYSIEYLMTDSHDNSDAKISMQDCVLAPILCRLPLLGINLRSNVAKYRPLRKYMNRILNTESFISSCSTEELSLLSI